MIESSILDLLKNKKNLLAFSAGVDSTALFFLLKDFDIEFDIAIVNYGVREQAKDEVLYAQKLAKKFNIKCYIHNAHSIKNNFEARAREIRYDFFNSIIESKDYNNLLTAHHLGDRFEWFLMQFCKGAGCAELASMSFVEVRKNYQLIRPLLRVDKSELLNYLNSKKIKYFEDESNYDEDIKRNYFRHKITNPLLKENLSGIKKSFSYLDEDKDILITKVNVESIDDFYYFKSSDSRSDIYTIDKIIKSLGHIISANERKLLKETKTTVLGRKYLVVQENGFIFITPYQKNNTTLSKDEKELFRTLKIDPKLRPFLAKNQKIFKLVIKLITKAL